MNQTVSIPDQLQFLQGQCSESTAQVYLHAHAELAALPALLTGPRCQFSHTLAADFVFRTTTNAAPMALVTEPCYWTPALPFLYDLQLGKSEEQKISVGLRRWTSQGSSFYLETRRTVLRGAFTDVITDEILTQARAAGTVLLLNHYHFDWCAAADRAGVPLVVDLRQAGAALGPILSRLDWSASVLLALVSEEQLTHTTSVGPRQCLLAPCLNASSPPAELLDSAAQAYAIELQPGESPPTWLADIDRPLVAIRRGVTSDDLPAARAACDRLQADLAPKLNLAGYFVAP